MPQVLRQPTAEERQLIGVVLSGDPGGLDALARLLWLSDPGPNAAGEALAESEYLAAHPEILEDMRADDDPERYLAMARCLFDWLFPAMRAYLRDEAGA